MTTDVQSYAFGRGELQAPVMLSGLDRLGDKLGRRIRALIEPIAGGTGFLFIALFLGIARKFDLSIKHSSVAMFIGLAGGLSLTVLLQSFDYLTSGLPGLPFLAVSFIGVHWREVKPGTKEMVTTIVFCLVAMLLMVFYRMAKG